MITMHEEYKIHVTQNPYIEQERVKTHQCSEQGMWTVNENMPGLGG
jgi:hypothetical protein